MSNESEDPKEEQAALDKDKSESKAAEAETEGSGGGTIFDDQATSDAKDAGKAEAEADRSTAENAKDDE